MITRTFLLALALVESGLQDIPGDDGKAQGPFQLHSIAVKEANRIARLKGLPLRFQPDDRHEYGTSMVITVFILDYWSKHWAKKGHAMTQADLCALHRWGPSRWRPGRTDSTELDRNRTKKLNLYLSELNKEYQKLAQTF